MKLKNKVNLILISVLMGCSFAYAEDLNNEFIDDRAEKEQPIVKDGLLVGVKCPSGKTLKIKDEKWQKADPKDQSTKTYLFQTCMLGSW